MPGRLTLIRSQAAVQKPPTKPPERVRANERTPSQRTRAAPSHSRGRSASFTTVITRRWRACTRRSGNGPWALWRWDPTTATVPRRDRRSAGDVRRAHLGAGARQQGFVAPQRFPCRRGEDSIASSEGRHLDREGEGGDRAEERQLVAIGGRSRNGRDHCPGRNELASTNFGETDEPRFH